MAEGRAGGPQGNPLTPGGPAETYLCTYVSHQGTRTPRTRFNRKRVRGIWVLGNPIFAGGWRRHARARFLTCFGDQNKRGVIFTWGHVVTKLMHLQCPEEG